jgi:pimeloyl-ACP methyl ester carboxylesterase
MEHAKVNGVELEYEVVGSGEAMLLIHGAHLADALQPLVAEPALERFQRIRYHRRGFGGSTYPVDAGPTSVAVQAEDAAGLLDHVRVDRAHLVGHSWGGSIALELAAQHPTRVASLVLLEPAFFTTPAGAAFARAVAPLIDRYEAGDAEGAVHGFLALVGDRNWHATIEETVPGAIAQAVKDAATFFELELPGPTWTFGAGAGGGHHLPGAVGARQPEQPAVRRGPAAAPRLVPSLPGRRYRRRDPPAPDADAEVGGGSDRRLPLTAVAGRWCWSVTPPMACHPTWPRVAPLPSRMPWCWPAA